jgi:hypothetical protein
MIFKSKSETTKPERLPKEGADDNKQEEKPDLGSSKELNKSDPTSIIPETSRMKVIIRYIRS